MMMTREELGERLLALPMAIRDAETLLLGRESELAESKCDLDNREGEILLAEPPILIGKNAETRAAQLREQCAGNLGAVAEREYICQLQRIALRALQNEFSALRACARLLGGATE